jgi:glutamate synthase domain-containing protein 3
MKISLEREGDAKVFQKIDGRVKIDARHLHYRELNAMVKGAAAEGAESVEIKNVFGQRYIGSGVRYPVRIDVYGVPGNDLGAFMDGPYIVTHRNAQDGVGNTMNSGTVVVHGRAGDIVAMGMRGGKIFIKGSVGYRAAIHMKEYMKHRPLLVIGGTTQDFLGEYMAGGIVVVLGIGKGRNPRHQARHIGTGMHGGVIYLRGEVDDHCLGQGVSRVPLEEEDMAVLKDCIVEFVGHFGGDAENLLNSRFTKLVARSHRPFGNLYAY